MNRELDKSQIVNQWGPWTLTKDGNLHNSDISERVNENWYLSLREIKTQDSFEQLQSIFMHQLLLTSNQKKAWGLWREIQDSIFPSRVMDGKYDNLLPPWDVRNSSFYVDKYIQEKLENKRVNLRPSLRFKILHRDQYRCRTCGATAADGAKLHVDHILPVSKGGTNDESNLRALCSECNIGRGNRYDT